MAAKMDQLPYKVYTLLGDGELPEGSNWEAALTAAHYKLDNLVAIIDYNKLQITGPTKEVCNTEPIDEKFKAFGWTVTHVDGHNHADLINALNSTPLETNKPSLVIAHTIKGSGISYMENEKKWHHGVPNDEQYSIAMKELESKLKLMMN